MNSNITFRRIFMPDTQKQKNKARRSREAYMISDLENSDVMKGGSHYEKLDNEFGISVRRHDSLKYDAHVDHNSNTNSNSRGN